MAAKNWVAILEYEYLERVSIACLAGVLVGILLIIAGSRMASSFGSRQLEQSISLALRARDRVMQRLV